MQPISPKDETEIAAEWDAVARQRLNQLSTGRDISHEWFLHPTIIGMLGSLHGKKVLDIGCGLGDLSGKIARHAERCDAIDLSQSSIALAKERFSIPNLRFFTSSLIDASVRFKDRYDAAVANMVLSSMPNLEENLAALRRLLLPNGLFVCSLPHPWFWPHYWSYADEPWFEYGREIFITAPFATSRDSKPNFFTTHIHRPLQIYIKALKGAGFQIEEFREPVPEPSVQLLYPHPWRFPRFLFIGARAA